MVHHATETNVNHNTSNIVPGMAAMWDISVWSDPDACGRVVGASVVNKREQSSGGRIRCRKDDGMTLTTFLD